ncbi:hypothetical protein GGI25_006133 [Coemansia spiralis]|uniref:Uncharacterized protein n=2 Tax=Coemansia TaxID=4863 RepID=A0A9W8G2U2_9FUNG|nr:hypothetical protein GGI25_006133 [Coemansia spiralis]
MIRQRLSQAIELLHKGYNQNSGGQDASENADMTTEDQANDTSDTASAPRKRIRPAEDVQTGDFQQPSENANNGSDAVVVDGEQRESTLGIDEPQQQEPSGSTTIQQDEAHKDGLTAGDDTAMLREIRDLEDRISYCLQSFDEAPFTIQRIAELLAWPERHYRSTIKFLRALERVVYVTSTIDEFPPTSNKSKEVATGESELENKDISPTAIEGARVANPPPSLFSFLASQDTDGTGIGSEAVASMATKAVAAKDKQPAVSLTAISAATSTSVLPSYQDNGVVQARAPKNWPSGNQSPIDAMQPPAVGGGGIPPLDASDTGILHITPTTAEDGVALKSKISESVDASVPVCIDAPNGDPGILEIQPIDPHQTMQPKQSAGEPFSNDKTID